eukprot:TRINITY_DN74533_c0_g1_i1.p1 TRINITY_DN74533_c0_g1~~TRINITY_DN74533_c0_g1_i1.p1  ORF type:complete len:633 (+),score=97.85 TRINITY_DN74533_c0_g1_i1:58-1956(+)
MADDASADENALSWLNMLLGSIWPKANTALMKYVQEVLTPALQDMLPGALGRWHFARMTLGRNVPHFGPIQVQRHSDTHVQIELDMKYFSDVDILVDTGTVGISFGIKQVTFVGRLCIALKPLLQHRPVVGGVHLFFANQPRVTLGFSGLAKAVEEFPGIKQKVQTVVDDFFRERVVLPKMRSFHFTKDEGIIDLTQASSHPPLGVLRVRILAAKNLAGAAWQWEGDRFTSDPYCVVKLGSASGRSSTARGSSDTRWPSTERSLYFVVHHPEQELDISVYQEDVGILRRSFVGFLGKMPAKSVRHVFGLIGHASPVSQKPSVRVTLDTSQVKKEFLHVNDPVNTGVPSELEFELEWFNLRDSGSNTEAVPLTAVPNEHRARNESPYAVTTDEKFGVVLVELHTGYGFPNEYALSSKGLRWQCRLGDEHPARSKRGEIVVREANFGVPIHPKIIHVVLELVRLDVPLKNIADICDMQPEVIMAFLQARKEFLDRAAERERDMGEDRCVEMRWHDTVSLIALKPSESNLFIELVEGESKVVGHLDPISVQQMLLEGLTLEKSTFKLSPTGTRSGTTTKAGALSAWLFPSCNKPVVATASRYRAVRVDLAVRLLPVAVGDMSTPWSSPHWQRGVT